MDQKVCGYPKRRTIELQHSQESSSNELPTSRSNISQTASTALDKRNKKRKKAKSDHIDHGSRNIWKNLSNMFAKSSFTTEPISVNLVKDKDKGSTLRRLSSFFKHQKSSSDDVITPITNMGVSRSGYQSIVSETKFQPFEEKEIAMAIRLPSGSNTENVAVTIELEALKKEEELATDDNSDEIMVMKRCEETESKTTFTGILKVPPHTVMSKLANMPLYIIDSHEQLVFHPGAEISYRKHIRPSEDMLLSDDEDCAINMDCVRIKVRLDKINVLKKGTQQNINSVNRKTSTENDLINLASDENITGEKITNKNASITGPPVADIINVLDIVYSLRESEDVRHVSEIRNKKKSTAGDIRNILNESRTHALEEAKNKTALVEVLNVNESANHIQEAAKRTTNFRNIFNESAMYTPEKTDEKAISAEIRIGNESDEYETLNAIVDDALDSAKVNSKEAAYMCVKQGLDRTANTYYDVEEGRKPDYNTDPEIEKNDEQSIEHFTIHQNRIPHNYTLVGKPLERLNTKSRSVQPTTKTIRDSSTQYSNSYFTTDKEVDTQYSLIRTSYGIFNENYSSPVTSNSQTLLFPPGNQGNLINKLDRISNSNESSETVMPNSITSTTTAYSSTLLSDYSTYYDNDLKVPLNSPISTTNVQNCRKEIKGVSNVLDLSASNQDMNEISKMPVSYMNTNQNSKSTQQQTNDIFSAVPSLNVVESTTVEEPSHKFVSCSSTEQELYLTNFDVNSKEELKFEQHLNLGSKQELDKKSKDKTLQLLEGVRLKLEEYLIRTGHSKKIGKTFNQTSSDWCGFFANNCNLDGLVKKVTDVRNVTVSCNNPFNPYEYNKRCYEDDDEYYESRRKDVRRYFQNDNLSLLMDNDEMKKNYDFYLSGDNLNAGLDPGNTTYQPYPLIINSNLQVRSLKSLAQIKFNEFYSNTLQGRDTNQISTLPLTNKSMQYDLPVTSSICFKLEAELNTLQQMYDNMRSQMKFLLEFEENAAPSTSKEIDNHNAIKSWTIENISDGLTSNFHELKYRLSTINQILAKSTISLQNIGSTLPSAWELFPIASDIFYNNSSKANQTKRVEPSITSRSIDSNIPTILEPFSTVFGDHSSKENIKLSSSSKNYNTITPTTLDFFPAVSDLLTEQHQRSNSFESVETIMSTIIDPLSTISDLLGDHLSETNEPNQLQRAESTNIYTVLPTTLKPYRTVSDRLCDHSSKENQTWSVSQSRSKNVYTVLPTTLEPTSKISDLLRKHSLEEIQTQQVQSTTSSENVNSIAENSLELFPTIFAIFNDHFVKTIQANHSSPSRSNMPTVLEPNSAIFIHSKSDKNKQSQSETSCEYIDAIMPTASELFPTVCNLLLDYSPKSSQTKLTHSTSSLKNVDAIASTTISDLLTDSLPKEIETIMDESSTSSSERSETYFAMESEIERTIKELLKESEDIKETVILNGGKEEVGPPFSVEYINVLSEGDPLIICKKIMEDVINSSTRLDELNKESKDKCGGPREDVKHILDALLEEIDKTDFVLDIPEAVKANKSKNNLEAVNFIYDTSYRESANIQIGDANNKPSSSKFSHIKNDCFTCFCSTAAFTPKIPKTSFSFGETLGTCLEIPHTGYKTPMKRRDCLNITAQENSTKELETARLFNELLNLQSDINVCKNDPDEKNDDSSSEEEFSSAHNIAEEFQEDATVSDMLDNFIFNENKNTQLQEVSPYKRTHTLEITTYNNSVAASPMESENVNNAENSESEENSPKHSPKSEDKTAQQNHE